MIAKTDLKFYLTAAEANLLNVTMPQSVGGYPSLTVYEPNALLTDDMDTATDILSVDSSLAGSNAVIVNGEVMLVDSLTEVEDEYGTIEILSVQRASLGTTAKCQATGSLAFGLARNRLFNKSLNDTSKQYRCLAIRNTHATDICHDVKVYFKSPSRNSSCEIKMAVEIPLGEIEYGTTTAGGSILLTDSSLAGAYDDNYFVGRMLVIDDIDSQNYNVARVVASYGGNAGTFTFTTAFPYSIESGITYRLEEFPAQRLSSGRLEPATSTTNTVRSAWTLANGLANGIDIDVSGSRSSGSDLHPYETVYLWLQRDVSDNAENYLDNRIVFTVAYKTS